MQLQVHGARIHYERSGSGFPVILLHAGIADSRMWEPQVAAFGEHFDVVRPEERGFGKSELPAMRWSPIADLLQIMDPRVSKAAGPLVTVWLIPPALALIVGGSAGLVAAALALAGAWHVPQSLVGALALAGLTSLPNAYAAVRLALRGHGAAVVSETLNSNTINLLAGLALPALVYGGGAGHAPLDLAWLLGMTVLALLLLARPRGLTRAGGAVLIALYLVFVIVRVSRP